MHADSEAPFPAEEHVELAVEVLRMIADPTRMRLVWLLSEQERSVNDLAARLGKQPSTVSQHLAKLRMARLVRTRREGTQVFYRVEDEHLAQLVRDAVFHAEHAAGDLPSHHAGDAAELPSRDAAR